MTILPSFYYPRLILFFLIALDLFSKQCARRFLAQDTPVFLFGDAITLMVVTNYDGFAGTMAAMPHWLHQLLSIYVFAVATTLLVVVLLKKEKSQDSYVLPLVLVTAGALGNGIDKIMHGGGVTDFIQLNIALLQTGIFNFADFFIISGSFGAGYVWFSCQKEGPV
ncbi:signal peptidase II [Desulforhopalus singaporensis]|uniref:Signal peptidase (SPase) II n=1 Tax=Desulforhopalus singaporensis TaxID=91360 RepID=A0A1H0TPU0_9BACT|nr:signal peptidase II [Desulforhopalus singaporensis]SDP55953.1 Signal peptidase (SPase) II [Desulforhopalus singaporensis]